MTAQTTEPTADLATVVPIKVTTTADIAERVHRVHGRILDAVTALVRRDEETPAATAVIAAVGLPSDEETRDVIAAAFLVDRLLGIIAAGRSPVFWETFADQERGAMLDALTRSKVALVPPVVSG
jgi:hypothetical protein